MSPDTPAVPPKRCLLAVLHACIAPKGKVPIGEIKAGDEVAVYTKDGLVIVELSELSPIKFQKIT